MKKRIMTIALALCLLAVAAMGTIAYFTDTESAQNVFTFGEVDIVQNEKMINEDGEFVDFVSGGKMLPMKETKWSEELVEYSGSKFKVFNSDNYLSKIVTVTNEGNTDAYVRTIVALEGDKHDWYDHIALSTSLIPNADPDLTEEDTDLIVNINGTDYIIVVYTYNKALAAGETSKPSITGVALYPETTQEEIVKFGDEYEVLVVSQAVQADDMGDSAEDALDKAFGDVNATSVKTWFEEIF